MPVVFVDTVDPVAARVVTSLARPGGYDATDPKQFGAGVAELAAPLASVKGTVIIMFMTRPRP